MCCVLVQKGRRLVLVIHAFDRNTALPLICRVVIIWRVERFGNSENGKKVPTQGAVSVRKPSADSKNDWFLEILKS
jgi:hypothetical protein